jgi:hypothetical protein
MIGTVIYFVITYFIMLISSLFIVLTMHKPSVFIKLLGVVLFIFAPVTLPLLIITVILVNVLE